MGVDQLNTSSSGDSGSTSGGGLSGFQASSVSGPTEINLGDADVFEHTLTGDVEYSLAGASDGVNEFVLLVKQDEIGGRGITWPPVNWSGGNPPVLSEQPNDSSLIRFISPDGGSTYIGYVKSDDYSAPPIIVDRYEDGDISEYTEYSQALANTNIVYEGTYALQLSGGNSGNSAANSTSGLPVYPQPGDTFSCRVYIHNGYKCDFKFGVQSEGTNNPDSYGLELNNNSSEIILYARGGSSSDSIPVDPPNDEWLKCEVSWGTDGSIIATVYDSAGNQLGQLSINSTLYTSGGIGFSCTNTGSDETYYYDNVVIKR